MSSDGNQALGDHIISIFEPVLVNLEEQVNRVEKSQLALRGQLDSLLETLRLLKENSEGDQFLIVLEDKSKKLIALKRKLTLVHTLLQNSNERCRKLITAHPIVEKS